jgi:predicted nucleic acid-binding protein
MKSKYILDTCTLSHLLEGRAAVVERITQLPRSETFITPITIVEAYFGIMTAPDLKKREVEEMKMAMHSFETVEIDATVAYIHAELKSKANLSGCKKDNDLWMVAFCEYTGAILITTDARLEHLQKFTGRIEIIHI